MGAATHRAQSETLDRDGNRRFEPRRRSLLAHLGRLEGNCFLIAVLGVCAAGEASLARGAITPDSWYALLSGHVVATSGLPGRDHLAVMTAGRAWVDQQWLGQLALYALW